MSEGPGSGVTPRACNSYPHCARPRPLISHQLVQASHPFYLLYHDDQGIDLSMSMSSCQFHTQKLSFWLFGYMHSIFVEAFEQAFKQ